MHSENEKKCRSMSLSQLPEIVFVALRRGKKRLSCYCLVDGERVKGISKRKRAPVKY